MSQTPEATSVGTEVSASQTVRKPRAQKDSSSGSSKSSKPKERAAAAAAVTKTTVSTTPVVNVTEEAAPPTVAEPHRGTGGGGGGGAVKDADDPQEATMQMWYVVNHDYTEMSPAGNLCLVLAQDGATAADMIVALNDSDRGMSIGNGVTLIPFVNNCPNALLVCTSNVEDAEERVAQAMKLSSSTDAPPTLPVWVACNFPAEDHPFDCVVLAAAATRADAKRLLHPIIQRAHCAQMYHDASALTYDLYRMLPESTEPVAHLCFTPYGPMLPEGYFELVERVPLLQRPPAVLGTKRKRTPAATAATPHTVFMSHDRERDDDDNGHGELDAADVTTGVVGANGAAVLDDASHHKRLREDGVTVV